MNEEQRKQGANAKTKPNLEKDYSKYFEHVYQPPNLKDAKQRGKSEVQYHDDFKIDERHRGMGKGRKFYIRTYGCQMNEHDTEVMAGIFQALGFAPTNSVDDADVILLNTCAIRENAENRVFSEIGNLKHLKQERPDCLIGVCGCMSQEESVVNKILKSYQNVDMIFGTHNIHRLPEILEEAYMSKAMVVEVWSKEGDVIENLPKVRNGRIKAWVNIMYGCDKFCTYCIVPFTRGKERSRMPEEIIAEVRDLARQGYQEICLLGQNVNAYGKDIEGLNYGLGDLLNDMTKIDIPRVRFTTSHPWDFDDRLIEVIAEGGNIVPHIHLPVQSGNNKVLKIMGRKYTRESYLELVNKIKEAIPDIALTTDIIVGYPNETEEQFQNTIKLVEAAEFEGAYTFIYSKREGTPAASMPDSISEQEKHERLTLLNQYINKGYLAGHQRFLNQIVEVLVDGPSKNGEGMMCGYTKHLKLTHFKSNDLSLVGKMVKVKITEAKTWFMIGELCE